MTSLYNSIVEDLTEDSFNINFRVSFPVISPHTGLAEITSFSVFQPHLLPFILPCECILRDVPRFLRQCLFRYLPYEHNLQQWASHIISYYQQTVTLETRTTHRPRLIPLFVDILLISRYGTGFIPVFLIHRGINQDIIEMGYDSELTELYVGIQQTMQTTYPIIPSLLSVNIPFDYSLYGGNIQYMVEDQMGYDPELTELVEAIDQSLQLFSTVPASEESTRSLRKLTFSNEERKANQCSICLENFEDEDEDISALPCDHYFHCNCIVKWLEMSHTCPLCRFRMPVE